MHLIRENNLETEKQCHGVKLGNLSTVTMFVFYFVRTQPFMFTIVTHYVIVLLKNTVGSNKNKKDMFSGKQKSWQL